MVKNLLRIANEVSSEAIVNINEVIVFSWKQWNILLGKWDSMCWLQNKEMDLTFGLFVSMLGSQRGIKHFNHESLVQNFSHLLSTTHIEVILILRSVTHMTRWEITLLVFPVEVNLSFFQMTLSEIEVDLFNSEGTFPIMISQNRLNIFESFLKLNPEFWVHNSLELVLLILMNYCK